LSKSIHEIKEQFINDLITELNDINERDRVYYGKTPLDVCYMVSIVNQQIENCTEFMNDISTHRYCINGYDEDYSQGYTNGRIRVLIEKPDEEKESEYMVDAYHPYCYYIEFQYDERLWGYCQCEPKDEGYNADKHCCGMGCDWTATAFIITREENIGYYKWSGFEKDYWEYEKEFNANEKNKNAEVEAYEKELSKQYLKKQIEELQNKLNKLELLI
jgi:hypothetical protein